MRSYARPHDLGEAVRLMQTAPRRILAGGTDIYPATGRQIDGDVLDVTAIPELTGITAGDGAGDGIRLGACTTWTAIATADLPPGLHGLQQAAGLVGGRQVQNAGTIGGNLCTASPAADGVPPLLVLDAEVELVGPNGLRQMPLAQFLTGPRQTRRMSDEMLTAIIIPKAALQGRSAFGKLGARAYLVISIAMVAVRVDVALGRITTATVAVGACSGVAQRLARVEAALQGCLVGDAADRVTRADVAGALSPIDDLRATADYRVAAATELIRRTLRDALT